MAGYAAHHPEKVGRLVLLAPAYHRDAPIAEYTDGSNPPDLPVRGPAFAISNSGVCIRESVGRAGQMLESIRSGYPGRHMGCGARAGPDWGQVGHAQHGGYGRCTATVPGLVVRMGQGSSKFR
jgi:pimeloyl-ACP methyl ester carboxylesterase